MNWLPKRNPVTNRRLENQTRAGFSALLTTRGVFECANLHLIFDFQRTRRTAQSYIGSRVLRLLETSEECRCD
jgi:hypothetical protein